MSLKQSDIFEEIHRFIKEQRCFPKYLHANFDDIESIGDHSNMVWNLDSGWKPFLRYASGDINLRLDPDANSFYLSV